MRHLGGSPLPPLLAPPLVSRRVRARRGREGPQLYLVQETATGELCRRFQGRRYKVVRFFTSNVVGAVGGDSPFHFQEAMHDHRIVPSRPATGTGSLSAR